MEKEVKVESSLVVPTPAVHPCFSWMLQRAQLGAIQTESSSAPLTPVVYPCLSRMLERAAHLLSPSASAALMAVVR
jgi:hypothetical protein